LSLAACASLSSPQDAGPLNTIVHEHSMNAQ
jgi:hypothetical protein